MVHAQRINYTISSQISTLLGGCHTFLADLYTPRNNNCFLRMLHSLIIRMCKIPHMEGIWSLEDLIWFSDLAGYNHWHSFVSALVHQLNTFISILP